MSQRRPFRLLPVGPFQNDDPLARHAPGLLKCPDRIIRLVQDVSQEDEVEGAIFERQAFRNCHLKRDLGSKAPRHGKEIGVRINSGHAKGFLRKDLCKDPGPRADVQDAGKAQAVPAEPNNICGIQERQPFRGAKALSPSMETALMRTVLVFHPVPPMVTQRRIYRIKGAQWLRIRHSSFQ